MNKIVCSLLALFNDAHVNQLRNKFDKYDAAFQHSNPTSSARSGVFRAGATDGDSVVQLRVGAVQKPTNACHDTGNYGSDRVRAAAEARRLREMNAPKVPREELSRYLSDPLAGIEHQGDLITWWKVGHLSVIRNCCRHLTSLV